jgi:3-hydroxyacyl-CoA dehydrogenase / enoyl-CoA hydratase / 3-hydroxybutyryl-CoA epimerase
MSGSDGTASAVRYDRDADGIVVLTLDDPAADVNLLNDAYRESMAAAVDRLEGERDDGTGVTGVVVTSAKHTFFAGADLRRLSEAGAEDAARVFAEIEDVKGQLRRLEKLGRPVVAAVNGSALGAGLEIALACHHRIALDDPATELGLPEVTLGLLPGVGGVTRVVRMIGLYAGLVEVLLPGTRFRPAAARDLGLLDELLDAPDGLVPAAKAWVLAHRADGEAAAQPWDRPGYQMPGGTPGDPGLAALLPALPANLRRQLNGASYPAPRALLSAAVEGAAVDFDTASRIESRYLTKLVVGQTSTNLIQAFFDLEAVRSGAQDPRADDLFRVARLGVVGAGRMGAGIAYLAARSGIDVVLQDVDAETAARGTARAAALLAEQVSRGRVPPEQSDAILARITPTADPADLAGADAVIEAVFEDPDLKAAVHACVQDAVSGALLASNTSSLPISGMAETLRRPEDLVGLHFFSPVERMPLVEVVQGARTSTQTLARALDLVGQLGRTPVVVNDGRGFFTTRVYGTFLTEAAAVLEEGADPQSVERAATTAGFAAPPLTMLDEVSLTLARSIRRAAQAAAEREGGVLADEPGAAVIDRMLELGRPGRAAGAGFYDYPDGGRKRLWPGLREHFGRGTAVPLSDISERYLFRMALETARCFEDGVVGSAAAANVASLRAIGFPPLFGGTVQYMQGYEGPTGRGLQGFVARARALASSYGVRFEPPPYLVDLAQQDRRFPA